MASACPMKSHQFMMIIAAREARLKPPELVPRVHLGHHQGDGDPMVDTMEGNVLIAHMNVLEAVCQQVASGIQSPDSIIRHQLEGLQLLYQGYNKEQGIRQKDNRKARTIEGNGVLLEILPATLASNSTNCARVALPSLSTTARAAWEAFKASSQ